MNLSIIIPTYNEAENIESTVREVLSVCEALPTVKGVDVLVVDDHSSDTTFSAVNGLNDPRVQCIRLSKRSGSHIALRAGLMQAAGDAVLCLSADGQDNPEAVEKMVEKWKAGAKVVWALRENRQKESWLVSIPARIFYKILMMFARQDDVKVDLSRADFYLLDKKVVDAINGCAETKTSLFGLILWVGFKHDHVEYVRRERKAGRSKWNLSRRLDLARDWIIAFSGLPLRMVFYVGISSTAIGFLYALIVVVNMILRNPVQGWSSLMVVILILGGIQMTMLGVVGEYLGQNLKESRKRPLFFIESNTKDPD